MRFAFPKKRRRTLPFLPILIFFTALMMVATVLGEGGVIHALSMRVVKAQALDAVEAKQRENRQMAAIIRRAQSNPMEAQKFLAAYAHLSSDSVTVYNFKSIEDLSDLEVIQHEDTTWWQKIELRVRLLLSDP